MGKQETLTFNRNATLNPYVLSALFVGSQTLVSGKSLLKKKFNYRKNYTPKKIKEKLEEDLPKDEVNRLMEKFKGESWWKGKLVRNILADELEGREILLRHFGEALNFIDFLREAGSIFYDKRTGEKDVIKREHVVLYLSLLGIINTKLKNLLEDEYLKFIGEHTFKESQSYPDNSEKILEGLKEAVKSLRYHFTRGAIHRDKFKKLKDSLKGYISKESDKNKRAFVAFCYWLGNEARLGKKGDEVYLVFPKKEVKLELYG